MRPRDQAGVREEKGEEMSRVLVAEDDEAVRYILQTALERDGFEVVAAANVREALGHIAAGSFDILLSDLHMPRAGDGLTVVSAMRHTHPAAVTLVLSGYPELDAALSAIRLQADDVLVKPIKLASLRDIIHDRLANPVPHAPVPTESIASILKNDFAVTIERWIEMVEQQEELTCVSLNVTERTGHLPNQLAELITRLRCPPTSKTTVSSSARLHGDLRRKQGYTAAMVVEESRILQVSIFNTVQSNLLKVDFSTVLLDVITIADEVDSQLKQAMLGYGSFPGPARSAA
jgi:CheY-like chemotaxis protein